MRVYYLKSNSKTEFFPLELFAGKTVKEPPVSELVKIGGSIVEIDEITQAWEFGSERELELIIRRYEKIR